MFFDGKVKPSKIVSSSGKKRESDKNSLLENTRKLREQRQNEKLRTNSCISIQAMYRGYTLRKALILRLADEFDKQLKKINGLKALFRTKNANFLVPLSEIVNCVKKLYIVYDSYVDQQRALDCATLVIESLHDTDINRNILTSGDLTDSYSTRILQKAFVIVCDCILRKLSTSALFMDSMPVDSLQNEYNFSLEFKLMNILESFVLDIVDRPRTLRTINLGKILIEYCCVCIGSIVSIKTDSIPSELATRLLSSLWNMIEFNVSIQDTNIETNSSKDSISNDAWAILTRHLFSVPNLNQNKLIVPFIYQLFVRHDDLIGKIFQNINSTTSRDVKLFNTTLKQKFKTSTSESSFESRNTTKNDSRVVVLGNVCSFLIDSEVNSNQADKASIVVRALHRDVIDVYQYILLPVNEALNKMPLNSVLYAMEMGFVTEEGKLLETYIDSAMNINFNHEEPSTQSSVKGLEDKLYTIQSLVRSAYFKDNGKNFIDNIGTYRAIVMFLLNPTTHSILFEMVDPTQSDTPSSGTNSLTRKIGITITAIYSSLLQNLPVLTQVDRDIKNSLSLSSKSSKNTSISITFLNSLAFSNPTNSSCKRLLRFLLSCYPDSKIQYYLSQASNLDPTSDLMFQEDSKKIISSALYSIAVVYHHQLSIMDDKEFFNEYKNLPVDEISTLVVYLRINLNTLFFRKSLYIDFSTWKQSDQSALFELNSLYSNIIASIKLFNDIFSRQERRKFTQDNIWQWQTVSSKDFDLIPSSNSSDESNMSQNMSFRHPNANLILSCIPQVIPFQRRLNIFYTLLEEDKSRIPRESYSHMISSISIQVRRDMIIEDTFEALLNEDKRMKNRIQVQFTSEIGTVEAGIDGGGLFKDFIDNFSKKAFSPEYGLFLPTSEQLLTPNPASGLVNDQHLQLYHVFGKVLGKAVYEGILSEPQFAGGFLNILLGRYNQIDDLVYLDQQFYTSLTNLKAFAADGGDVESLGLTFEVEKQVFGETINVELVPGGSKIPVTSQNLLTYIHRLAHYKLNVEIAEQSKAFLSGFRVLIPTEWIRMFSPRELQLLLSGDRDSIDLKDLRKNVVYGGGYADSQPYVNDFWNMLELFNFEEKSAFLKFVTSCPRQPLQGFGSLYPKFGIQKVPTYEGDGNVARLPSAATCMNLLKLPQYSSLEQLKEKLLYAIMSNSGFELS